MNSKNQAQTAGFAGMASAVLWMAALILEYHFHLQPPGNDSFLYIADQILFLIGFAGFIFMLYNLFRSKAAGEGIFGKISVWIFIVGLVSLMIATMVQLVTDSPNIFLFPIGGILQLLGGLLTGIAVVVAKRWSGWQRYAPLLQGLFYLLVLFLPVVVSNQEPTQLSETLWQVTWLLTSLALYTTSTRSMVSVEAAA
jgi:hypothetical protein